MEKYNSEQDTKNHIKRVQELLEESILILKERGKVHDLSKLSDPEKSLFDEMTPKLAGSTYGSQEYKDMLQQLKPALDHHYKMNSHHPEHYSNGINGMNIFDVIEMLIDWKAASERHQNGNIVTSIQHNQNRFQMSEQLTTIFLNTVNFLGWTK